jgi:hypothetical protein
MLYIKRIITNIRVSEVQIYRKKFGNIDEYALDGLYSTVNRFVIILVCMYATYPNLSYSITTQIH